MLDWNDIRYFLAVVRTGSTMAAAKQLKVSQATVSRRIMALEEQLGSELFVRRPSGYSLAARGEALLPAAEAVEAAISAFSGTAAAEGWRLSGEVRLTTVESAANTWVIPALAKLREDHPGVRVEVIVNDKNLDLLHGEADIAIRFGERPNEPSLVVRPLAELQMSFYASRDMVTRLGRPAQSAELARYPLVIDNIDRTGIVADWIASHVPDAQYSHRTNTLSALVSSVRAGLGAAVLPCMMGDDLRGLVRLMPPIPELTFACWLVTTDPARRQPHIRAVIDHVVDQIQTFTAARVMAAANRVASGAA